MAIVPAAVRAMLCAARHADAGVAGLPGVVLIVLGGATALALLVTPARVRGQRRS